MNIKAVTAFFLFSASNTACSMPGDIEDYGRGGAIGAVVGRLTGDYLFGQTIDNIGKQGGGIVGKAAAGEAQFAAGSFYKTTGVYIVTGVGACAGAWIAKKARDLFDKDDENQKYIGYALTVGALAGGSYVLYKYNSN